MLQFKIPLKYEEQCKVVPKFKYAKFDMHDKGKEKERNVLVDVELCSHDKIKDDMIGWWCNEWAKRVGCFYHFS